MVTSVRRQRRVRSEAAWSSASGVAGRRILSRCWHLFRAPTLARVRARSWLQYCRLARRETRPRATKLATRHHEVRRCARRSSKATCVLSARRSHRLGAKVLTQSPTLSAPFAISNFRHLFISVELAVEPARSGHWMANIGTFLPFRGDMSNGSSCQEPTTSVCPTGAAADGNWAGSGLPAFDRRGH